LPDWLLILQKAEYDGEKFCAFTLQIVFSFPTQKRGFSSNRANVWQNDFWDRDLRLNKSRQSIKHNVTDDNRLFLTVCIGNTH